MINELEEAGAVYDFHEGRAFGLAGADPDGGSVVYADALTQRIVSFDLLSEFALRIDREGEGKFASRGELLGEVLEVFAGDGGLIGEDGVAVVVAELLGFSVEPAGVDGGLEAPGMLVKRVVVADPGDVVLGCGFFEEWVGAGAVGALHIFKLDDRDAHAGRGDDRGGVVDLRGLAVSDEGQD